MYSCVFIDHRDCSSDIKTVLYDTAKNLIINENVCIFYVGTNGNFDYYVYNVLCQLEKNIESRYL